MASTRKSPPADPGAAVEAAIVAALPALRASLAGRDSIASRSDAVPPHPRTNPVSPLRVTVALSGGRDSIVLLHALSRLREAGALDLAALHVHHGLMKAADDWAAFCKDECARRAIPVDIVRVRVTRQGGESLEGAAREARYAALLAAHADAVALAHHADDQAETVLLQLLRGAGPHGLSAMGTQHVRSSGPRLWRPLLEVPAASIAAYARAHELAWVDDPSNADVALRRNALRHEVVPSLRRTFPAYANTLSRVARHQAEAARLLDDLAALDATGVAVHDPRLGLTLERRALAELAASRPDRARNVLRWFMRRHDLPPASTARLAALLAQCTSARRDARVELQHAGAVIESHRGHLAVHRNASAPFAATWQGETRLTLPGGVLSSTFAVGAGIAERIVQRGPLRVRPRRGGERLRLAVDGPRRSVAALFAQAFTPAWERDAWPFVWLADDLVAVPGVAVDVAFQAPAGERGYVLRWQSGSARAAR